MPSRWVFWTAAELIDSKVGLGPPSLEPLPTNSEFEMTTYDFDTKSSHRPRFQYTDEGIDWYILAHQFNTNHQLVEQCNSEFLSKPVLNEPEE